MKGWKAIICGVLGAVSICARAPDLSRECIVIEKIDGLVPAKTDEDLNLKHARGTSLKVGREYTLVIDLKFVAPVEHFDIRFSTARDSNACIFLFVSNLRNAYYLNESEKIACHFKPLLIGKDVLGFSPIELNHDKSINIIRSWVRFPLVIRPAMDLRCMTSLEGISMAAREGWLTLALGALAFVGLAWRRASLRKLKGWAWLAGWIGVTFLGQMGVWFLMDKLFLSYPERVFTPFDHFNLPAILSAVITLTAGWFALRKQGRGKANSA